MASIKKNFLYSSILTTANYLFPFLTYPYVARVLGVTNVGICNFVDSIINYFIIFSMLGIGTVGIREIAKYKNNSTKLNEAFSGLFLINFISTFIVLLVLIFSIELVPKLNEHRELMYFGALKLVFNFLLIEWFYKGLEDFKYITVRTIIVKCIYVISVFVFIHNSDDYVIYYILMTLMIVVNALLNIIHARKWICFSFKGIIIKPYLKSFFILGFYMLLTSMYTSFNVAYLGFKGGETEVGYYTTATKLYTIILSLYSAFTGVLLPRMSSLVAEKQFDKFRNLLNKSLDILFAFSLPLVIYSVIMAAEIIRLIAGEGYEGAVLPMKIVMPLIFIIGYEQILIIQTLMPLKKDKQILINSIFGASVGVIANLVLVPIYKSVGASVVWVISEITVLSVAQLFVYKDIGYKFPFRKVLASLLAYLPLVIFLVFIHNMSSSFWIKIVYSSLVLGIYTILLQVYILKNDFAIYCLKNIKSFIRK